MQNQPRIQPEIKESQWTILKLLTWTTSYFKSHEIDHPRAGAEILLAHTLNLRRIDLYLRYDQPLNAKELGLFKGLIRRRVRREPVAYIVGEKEFWSMGLAVTRDVLIPRPETECLVEAALTLLPEHSQAERKRILELGTGSGAIVLALASERPQHLYFASDISPRAVQLARQNARRHGFDEVINFIAGDWFAPLKTHAPSFDMIISNPPYIAAMIIGTLQPEIHKYEPRTALDGEADGLHCLRHIIRHAPAYLNPGGNLLLEIGHDQKCEVNRIVAGIGHYEDVVFIRDYSGYDRGVQMRRKR